MKFYSLFYLGRGIKVSLLFFCGRIKFFWGKNESLFLDFLCGRMKVYSLFYLGRRISFFLVFFCGRMKVCSLFFFGRMKVYSLFYLGRRIKVSFLFFCGRMKVFLVEEWVYSLFYLGRRISFFLVFFCGRMSLFLIFLWKNGIFFCGRMKVVFFVEEWKSLPCFLGGRRIKVSFLFFLWKNESFFLFFCVEEWKPFFYVQRLQGQLENINKPPLNGNHGFQNNIHQYSFFFCLKKKKMFANLSSIQFSC